MGIYKAHSLNSFWNLGCSGALGWRQQLQIFPSDGAEMAQGAGRENNVAVGRPPDGGNTTVSIDRRNQMKAQISRTDRATTSVGGPTRLLSWGLFNMWLLAPFILAYLSIGGLLPITPYGPMDYSAAYFDQMLWAFTWTIPVWFGGATLMLMWSRRGVERILTAVIGTVFIGTISFCIISGERLNPFDDKNWSEYEELR